MPDNKDGPSNFRVVDRRSFSSDGTPREPEREAEKPPEKPPGPTPPETRPEPTPPRSATDMEEPEGEGPLGFESLVRWLATTAMFQLGLMADPQGNPIPADLPNARRTIDMLEVLQEKTSGNLTADEVGLLEDVLYDLRLSFVEVNKQHSQRTR